MLQEIQAKSIRAIILQGKFEGLQGNLEVVRTQVEEHTKGKVKLHSLALLGTFEEQRQLQIQLVVAP